MSDDVTIKMNVTISGGIAAKLVERLSNFGYLPTATVSKNGVLLIYPMTSRRHLLLHYDGGDVLKFSYTEDGEVFDREFGLDEAVEFVRVHGIRS